MSVILLYHRPPRRPPRDRPPAVTAAVQTDMANPQATTTLPSAVVSARGAARIRAGHPWVFRQDVTRGPDGDAGNGGPSLVVVQDRRGKALGVATWGARAKLAPRLLQTGPRAPHASARRDLLAIVNAR